MGFTVFSVVIPDIPLPSSEHGSYGFYHSIAWIAFALSWSVSPRKRLSLNFHFLSHRSLDAAMMQTYTVTSIIVDWSVHNAEMGLGLPVLIVLLSILSASGSVDQLSDSSQCLAANSQEKWSPGSYGIKDLVLQSNTSRMSKIVQASHEADWTPFCSFKSFNRRATDFRNQVFMYIHAFQFLSTCPVRKMVSNKS